jgi:hypothetical protein
MFTYEIDGALAQIFNVVVFGYRVEYDRRVDGNVAEELETFVNERAYAKFVGAFQYRTDRLVAQHDIRGVDVRQHGVYNVGGKFGQINRHDFTLNDVTQHGAVCSITACISKKFEQSTKSAERISRILILWGVWQGNYLIVMIFQVTGMMMDEGANKALKLAGV